MNALILIASLFLQSSHADEFLLKSGDVLLQSVPCYLCGMIEGEENSAYSHAGVFVQENDEKRVMEAWGSVEKIPLQAFLKKRRKKSPTLVIRPIDSSGKELKLRSESLLSSYQAYFAGLSYDVDFLWDNSDAKGEKLYCSEFVAKLLNPFLPTPIPTKPMHYEKFRTQWLKYFHGHPPDQKPGMSPGDLERSPLFKKIGFL